VNRDVSFERALLLLAFTYLAWLGMMLIHEAGHVIGAVATGGTVQRVVWHPLAISQTDVSPNPSPLMVAWAGPVVGVIVPPLLAIPLRRTCGREIAAFFVGFCLICNGAYLGLGWIDRVGDAGELLRLGSPRWTLITFGTIATVAGAVGVAPAMSWPVPSASPGNRVSFRPISTEQTGSAERIS
jgi:hypothetical protein